MIHIIGLFNQENELVLELLFFKLQKPPGGICDCIYNICNWEYYIYMYARMYMCVCVCVCVYFVF